MTKPTRRRVAVLQVLKDAGQPMSITDIAEELAVHPNTVRFHLDHLAETGQVDRVEPDHTKPGRPAQLFRAARVMDPTGPRDYRTLAGILVERLAAERNSSAKATEAGRAWGHRLAADTRNDTRNAEQSIERLIAALDELGFAPDRDDSAGEPRIALRHCPFLELAEQRSAVVCPIHLGLMQGALETWNAPVSVTRLDPFVEPDVCVTHLAVLEEAR